MAVHKAFTSVMKHNLKFEMYIYPNPVICRREEDRKAENSSRQNTEYEKTGIEGID